MQVTDPIALEASVAHIRPDLHNLAVEASFADLVRANLLPVNPQSMRREQMALARLERLSTSNSAAMQFVLPGVLASPARRWPELDAAGAARMSELEANLAAVGKDFPGVETELLMCRYACGLLEGAWQVRARNSQNDHHGQPQGHQCELCACLPTPPARSAVDYTWRRSEGLPLVTKTWPYRRELDSVLTGGWVWTRTLNDSDLDLGLRHRYEDDILAFHEYKRVVGTLDTGKVTQRVKHGLADQFSVNGARALVSGLFAGYKRRLDEYWLQRHAMGETSLASSNPLGALSYGLLQLMDCLFWHVSPDSELWQEEHLAALVLCRFLDDMTDVRADAVTGEINNFWLSAMPVHEKALYAAAAMGLIKYGCTPEAHGFLWNTWLMTTTVVWQGLTGRHALWLDGITTTMPPSDDCLLCRLRPNACTGLLSGSVNLHFGPRPAVDTLSPSATRLVGRCREEEPLALLLFHRELAAFEAIHGAWQGNADTTWKILSRTYIAAVIATLIDGSRARDIQLDSSIVGAELFASLHQVPSGKENTALLAYMFGCAHPHFLWNCLDCTPTAVSGDWLDG